MPSAARPQNLSMAMDRTTRLPTGRAVAVVERDEDRDDVLLEDGQLLAKAGFTEDDRRAHAVYKFIQALDADQRAGFFVAVV